jgi:AraC-like DNA-binding protein
MEDFASSAMMRVIALGMRRLGIEHSTKPSDRAHVALADKREVLAAIAARHGRSVLLRIGQGVHDLPDEPLLIALRAARDPRDFMQRWQRLERFTHSRHRILQTELNAAHLRWQHVSKVSGMLPSIEEDLVVFGVLIASLQLISIEGLSFRFGETGAWYDESSLNCIEVSDASTLELRWQPLIAVRSPRVPADGLAVEARRCLQRDVGRTWSIASLSNELGFSPRTLQRKLAFEQTSFSSLLRAVRLASASHLLAEQGHSNAEVGYLSGFSDQAHFTREMKRAIAMTPGQYREVVNPDKTPSRPG